MDDDQKWLQAAAGLEADILYLKAASLTSLENEIQQLRMALAVYKKNAATGVAWPSPDDLYCINALPYGARVATATRRCFKTA
jgi:hypothetical protein